tara:strand:- start:942 stop:1139 length:198 start_codon:yes stop_codon:yes gene_type:complete
MFGVDIVHPLTTLAFVVAGLISLTVIVAAVVLQSCPRDRRTDLETPINPEHSESQTRAVAQEESV